MGVGTDDYILRGRGPVRRRCYCFCVCEHDSSSHSLTKAGRDQPMQYHCIYVRLKSGGQATGRELRTGPPPDHGTVLDVPLVTSRTVKARIGPSGAFSSVYSENVICDPPAIGGVLPNSQPPPAVPVGDVFL
jgi:hypothetical protein